jgi:hypothetical protein
MDFRQNRCLHLCEILQLISSFWTRADAGAGTVYTFSVNNELLDFLLETHVQFFN